MVGGIVVAIGIDALRHVDEPRQIPLAALPVLFGVHQITEAFVWWGLQDHVAHRSNAWPCGRISSSRSPRSRCSCPSRSGSSSARAARRWVIVGFGVLGIAVAVALTAAIFSSPLHAAIGGGHIEYSVDALSFGGQITELYVVATCGAMLASSWRDIELIGALNLIAVPVLMWMTINGFVSLWCFWAAIVSVLIARHMRRTHRGHTRIAASAQLRSA